LRRQLRAWPDCRRLPTDRYYTRSAPWVESRAPQHAHLDGFDLHAALTVPAQRHDAREPLEKLLRYCARPPIAQERLQELPTGRIALRLKTPWHDGGAHVVYEPLDLIAKLAALIPRPRKNIVLYHGVLSANAAWRSRVVAYGRAQTSIGAMGAGATSPAQDCISVNASETSSLHAQACFDNPEGLRAGRSVMT
jgi:hypothetical protein